VKGGRLARAAAPATVATLLVSDVVGDDLATIASGPTAPDPTTYADAISVLDRHDVDAPDAVCEHLERGAAGERGETPDASDPAFDRVDHHVLVGAETALDAAAGAAREHGCDAQVLRADVTGESRYAARDHVQVAQTCMEGAGPVEPPGVLLSGGETTVTVTGDGTGGPNLEFALAAALDAPPGVVVAAVDTDGEDGSTDAAGAIVDAETVPDGEREAVRTALLDNDAYTYLAGRDALVRTGPTGTNVNDLRVLVVEEPSGS